MADLWSIIEHNRQNSAALLKSVIGNFNSIIGTPMEALEVVTDF